MGFQVKFYTLRCIETQDSTEDELWVDFRGQRVWGRGDINNGEVRHNVNPNPFTMAGSDADVISLWDKDDLDPDDHLGDHIVRTSSSGRGEQVAHFTRDGAHYTLSYEVKPDNWWATVADRTHTLAPGVGSVDGGHRDAGRRTGESPHD